jgi:manganese-dependent inorganic pyrophosphatase
MGAIVAADYFGGKAGRTGDLNEETRYLIDLFKLETPELIRDFKDKQFYLVDFNQKTQLPKAISAEQVVGIIDHHALQEAVVSNSLPIRVDIEPWGSVNTVLAKKYYVANGRPVCEKIAQAMLGAIISDTLNLRSKTTTEHDREMVAYLAPIAKVSDVNAFAENMFSAKSRIAQKSASAIIMGDFKEYQIEGRKIGFGVAETVHPEVLLERKQELLMTASEIKTKDGFDLMFFAVVDSRNLRSDLLILGPAEEAAAEKAYGGKTTNQVLDIGNRFSRKAQMIPELHRSFEPKD